MTPQKPIPSEDHEMKISSLLEILSSTGRRLEELTSGQVDTAADCEGRILLLKDTREQLKRSELATQAGILDALPANIALLDVDGKVVSVNKCWRQFAMDNMMRSDSGQGVGLNYLKICETASAAGAPDAHLIAAGIRSVLDGTRKSFSADYECSSPDERRWFHLTVTPLADDRPKGVIVTHVDVSATKEHESKLQLLAKRLSLAAEVAKVGVWEWDLTSDELTWDDTMFGIYGIPRMASLSYRSWSSAVHSEDLPQTEAMLRRTMEEQRDTNSEFRIIGAGGVVRYISAAQRVIVDGSGNPTRVIGVNVDVTERKESEAALLNNQALMTHLAQHDFLTDLPNQMLLHDRIDRAIKLADRNNKKAALLFLDMDGFKHINDSLGHPVGDKLLKSVARRLLECVRVSDTVSRLGGDEFIVLLPEVDHPEGTALTAMRMLEAVGKSHSIEEHDLQISACIGVSVYPDDGSDANTLIKNADAAMYQAKKEGRSRFHMFHADLNIQAVERQFIEQNLRRVLERNELALHYQPKLSLRNGDVTGVEALLRWIHPTRGPISPAKFIPVAEDCGLIVPIGQWVLREACRQACVWGHAGLPPISVAVNVSARQFQGVSFQESLFTILDETGMNPEHLELEVTESLLMTNPALTALTLQNLRATGVKVAIDDFGTGFSNLSYLQKFPTDTLKIDQSFVRQLTTSRDGISIVTAIITMGRSLGMNIVAEGVETEEELTILRALDCDEAQGFYFSRAVPPEEFETYLQRRLQSQVFPSDVMSRHMLTYHSSSGPLYKGQGPTNA